MTNKNKKTKSKVSPLDFLKKNKWVGGIAVGALLVGGYFLAGNLGDTENGNEAPDSETAEVRADDEENNQKPDSDFRKNIYGYWQSEAYDLFLTETRFYIQHRETKEADVYDLYSEQDEPKTGITSLGDTVEFSLGESKEDEVEEASKMTLTYKENEDWLIVETVLVENGGQVRVSTSDESAMDPDFLEFVASDGKKTAAQRENLTIEDFSGYWAPFDRTPDSHELVPEFGTYMVYIDECYEMTGFVQSSLLMSYIYDYTIEGNSMTYEAEVLHHELSFLKEGLVDFVERDIFTTTIYLFEEEEERDRLVFSNGLVLQRVSKDELIASNENLLEDKLTEGPNPPEAVLENLSEEQYTINRHLNMDESVKIENYPYSIGELSEAQLLEEKKIIQGQLPHPEESVDEGSAIKQLLARAFESTPSIDYLNHSDRGYYFTPEYDETDRMGSVTFGSGGRTFWQSTPQYLHVLAVDLEDHIYTLRVFDTQANQEIEPLRFYRISDEIIYAEHEGEFTRRFEQGTDWEDFKNLPSRDH